MLALEIVPNTLVRFAAWAVLERKLGEESLKRYVTEICSVYAQIGGECP